MQPEPFILFRLHPVATPPQGVPADQFGSDPVDTVVATVVVNGDDVGVVERARRAGFHLETGDANRGRAPSRELAARVRK